MRPEQEAAANEAANKIIRELTAATTPEECAEIAKRTDKIFKRLQDVHNVRAIHIVNLAKMKNREFARAAKEQQEAFDL